MAAIDRTMSARAKIERAKEHIRNLESQINACFSQPDLIIVDDDIQTGDRIFRFPARPDLFFQWGVIVGDIVHNLRSALDHFAWQLVDSHPPAKASRSTEFPIFKSSQDYESKLEAKIRGACPAAIRKLEELKLYDGGNDIFILHALSIQDKHRLLITIGSALLYGTFKPQMVTESLSGEKPFVSLGVFSTNPIIFSLKDGAEIYRIPTKLRGKLGVDMNPNFTFSVAIQKSGISERQSIIEFLTKLAELTHEIIAIVYQVCPEVRT